MQTCIFLQAGSQLYYSKQPHNHWCHYFSLLSKLPWDFPPLYYVIKHNFRQSNFNPVWDLTLSFTNKNMIQEMWTCALDWEKSSKCVKKMQLFQNTTKLETTSSSNQTNSESLVWSAREEFIPDIQGILLKEFVFTFGKMHESTFCGGG